MNIIGPILTGIVSGIVATGFWTWLYFSFWRPHRLKRRYKRLVGTYRQIPKSDEDPVAVPFPHVSIEFKGPEPVLYIHGVSYPGVDPDRLWVGEIWMNEEFPNTGKGHYYHLEGRPRWGSYEIFIRDGNRIQVRNTYVKKSKVLTYGWLWERID